MVNEKEVRFVDSMDRRNVLGRGVMCGSGTPLYEGANRMNQAWRRPDARVVAPVVTAVQTAVKDKATEETARKATQFAREQAERKAAEETARLAAEQAETERKALDAQRIQAEREFAWHAEQDRLAAFRIATAQAEWRAQRLADDEEAERVNEEAEAEWRAQRLAEENARWEAKQRLIQADAANKAKRAVDNARRLEREAQSAAAKKAKSNREVRTGRCKTAVTVQKPVEQVVDIRALGERIVALSDEAIAKAAKDKSVKMRYASRAALVNAAKVPSVVKHVAAFVAACEREMAPK